MPDQKQLQQDFTYIRSALERQRRFIHDYVPVWLAILIGLFLVTTFGVKDLTAMGYLSQETREWAVNIGFLVLVGILFIHSYRRRKACRAPGFMDKSQRANYYASLIGPWVIYIGGILLFHFAADSLGLNKEQWRTFALIYSGCSLALIGIGRLSMIFWFGLGTLAGTSVFIFTPFPLPYTALGVAMALGLVFGAWLDHRAAQRLGADG